MGSKNAHGGKLEEITRIIDVRPIKQFDQASKNDWSHWFQLLI
jgi:hypothetical protein